MNAQDAYNENVKDSESIVQDLLPEALSEEAMGQSGDMFGTCDMFLTSCDMSPVCRDASLSAPPRLETGH